MAEAHGGGVVQCSRETPDRVPAGTRGELDRIGGRVARSQAAEEQSVRCVDGGSCFVLNRLVQRSRFVPHAECQTPVPAWKTREWARDVLRVDDPANQPGVEVVER